MTTLAEVHAQVSRHLNKGTSLDNAIPDVVRQRARFLEQNYSFEYMKQLKELTLPLSCRGFNAPLLVKEYYFFRFTYDDDDFTYLNKVEPHEVSSYNGTPSSWWLDGGDKIRLDAELSEETSAEIYYAQYTSWPTDYNETPKLVVIAESALVHASVMAMMPYTRNQEGFQLYANLLKDDLTLLTGAEIGLKIMGASMQMLYR